jgi:hypothetical protein
MTDTNRKIYICRICHRVDQRPMTCHPGQSVTCDAGSFGDERSRPLFDKNGRLVTRAPKWWVDACMEQLTEAEKNEEKSRSRIK